MIADTNTLTVHTDMAYLLTNMSNDKAGCLSNYPLQLPLEPGCPRLTCRAIVKGNETFRSI